MEKVRAGVVGVGGMGGAHCKCLKEIEKAEIVGVCDVMEETAKKVGEEYSCQWFTDYEEMLSKAELDALLIATPHPTHKDICVAGAEAGVNVFTEKPMASKLSDADTMIEACKDAGVLLGVMYQQRTNPALKKLHELIATGVLGELYRTGMVMANFRTQAYYDSAAWRGTWKGEGGGVLANQAPHYFDMFQWLGGMPKWVTARTSTLMHKIQVEDVATAIFEYPNGAHGYAHTSTLEFPGTSRYEFAGNLGKAIYEGTLKLYRVKPSVKEAIMGTSEAWSHPEAEEVEVEIPQERSGHIVVIEDFINAIIEGRESMIPGKEGRKSVELINAITLSSFRRKTVELPLDAGEYDELMEELCARSEFSG